MNKIRQKYGLGLLLSLFLGSSPCVHAQYPSLLAEPKQPLRYLPQFHRKTSGDELLLNREPSFLLADPPAYPSAPPDDFIVLDYLVLEEKEPAPDKARLVLPAWLKGMQPSLLELKLVAKGEFSWLSSAPAGEKKEPAGEKKKRTHKRKAKEPKS